MPWRETSPMDERRLSQLAPMCVERPDSTEITCEGRALLGHARTSSGASHCCAAAFNAARSSARRGG